MNRDLTEQVSYLQGLTEGLNINDSGPQSRIISGMLEVLNEITINMRDMRNHIFELNEYVDSIDDDLCEILEGLGGTTTRKNTVEVECSNCKERLYFDACVLEGEDTIEIVCPRCNEVVFINDGSFDYEPGLIEDESLETQPNPSPS